jgi:eukaryotic-like serine/threonine-protein kinase
MPESELKLVGRYALCGVLGAGGMGTVHIGRLAGPHGFSRTVAIKRMHAHLSGDPEFTRLFLDEARLAARISHANVVSTLDVVQEGNELLVILEYVAGASLASLLRAIGKKGARLPVSVAATIVSQALHGLHAAHEVRDDHGKLLGLIHRDVAPDNLLVGTDGITRVLDFGIAKATELGRRTRDGRIKGKLRYMAPEQLRAQPLDRRADVYSAGAVLFETLTGRPLVGGNNDLEQLESLRQLEDSQKTPSVAAPSVPPVLDAIVRRAVAHRPEDRFQSADEMARALEREVGVAPPSTIAELVGAMASSEISRRKALLDEALTMTRDLKAEKLTSHPDVTPLRRPYQGPTQLGIEPNLRDHEAATVIRGATSALGTNDLEILEPSFRPSPRESELPAAPTASASGAAGRAPASDPFSLPALAPLVRPGPTDPVGPTLLSPHLPGAASPSPSLELGDLPPSAPVRRTAEAPLAFDLDRGPAGASPSLPAVQATTLQPTGATSAGPQHSASAAADHAPGPGHPVRSEPPRQGHAGSVHRSAAPPAAQRPHGRDGLAVAPAGTWAPTPPRSNLATILVPLVLVLASLGGFFYLRMRKNTADLDDVDPAKRQAELPAGATREECDLMRRRLRAGSPPTGLARGGWELDLWLRGRGGKTLDPKAVDTTLFQGQTSLQTRPFKPAAGPEDGIVITVAGPPTEAAFDPGRYGELIGAADRAFDSASAQQGALLLRCSHLESYDAALWFRGPDIEQVASSMLLTLGLATESPMLQPPTLSKEQTLFGALHDGVTRARHDDLTIYFQKNGATVDIKARSTRTTFSPESLAQSWRTTRFLSEAFPKPQ